MRLFKKYILLYLRSIFNETAFLATGFIGFILGYALQSIPYFASLSSWLIGSLILIICFFAAHISVIIKLHKDKEKLSLAIDEYEKNIPKFDINLNATKLTIYEKEKYIRGEIDWVKNELADISRINNPNYSGSINVKYLFASLSGNTHLGEDLKSYLNSLNEYLSFIEEIQSFNIINLEFTVANTGNIYDEDILVKINQNTGSFVLVDDIPLGKLQVLPERPKSVFEKLTSLTTAYSFPYNTSFNKPINKMFIADDNEIRLKIQEIHIGDSVTLADDEIILVTKKNVDVIKFDIEIVSRRTKKRNGFNSQIRISEIKTKEY